jgi:hypothetical protein
MQWNRSNVLGLAKVSCCTCHGYGLRVSKAKELPCHCVYRAIFRACYNRFHDCVVYGAHTSTVSLEFCPGREGRRTYSRKKEEFIADFCLVGRRELDDADYRLFRFHFLLGADWKLCCRQLRLERGKFFHSVYRIEQKLGRIFADLKPYSLYPLDEYFGTPVRREPPRPLPPPPALRAPLVPYFQLPLAEAA